MVHSLMQNTLYEEVTDVQGPERARQSAGRAGVSAQEALRGEGFHDADPIASTARFCCQSRRQR